VFRAGGGASLFALVLFWWESPYSIVGVERNIETIKEGTKKLVEEAQREESQSINWLSPDISALKAYDHVAKVFGKDIEKYELIEVLGSYYICLEPPKRTFLRFPEWIFTFRQRDTYQTVQYQIYDGLVPRPPSMTIRGKLTESDILYYNVLKEQYDDIQLRRNLEIKLGKRLRGNSFSLFSFDIRNLMYKADGGLAPDDQLIETRDSERFKVMGRYQALGRAFANPPTRGVKIQDFNGKY
jgi:hypothetical protein